MPRFSLIIPLIAVSTICAGGARAESLPAAGHTVVPVSIDRNLLDGVGLAAGDPSEFDGEGVEQEEGNETGFSTHNFHSGKIEVSVYETEPAKVRIEGLPYDEFILILEGRLILTTDDGQRFEFSEGDSLVLPRGYVGYWEMPEKYRELIVIDTSYKAADS